MNPKRLIAQMERTAGAIRHLVQGVSEDQASWRPTPDAWSVADVIDHLAYEEVHDFRDRLDLVLHRPDEPWPTADPARGVGQNTADGNTKESLARSLDAFLAARRASLDWLAGLEGVDWQAAHEAPFGRMRAGDVMAAWAAHDLLHLRQLTELHWAYLTHCVEPYELRYAGPW
jgi:hypothetical protein